MKGADASIQFLTGAIDERAGTMAFSQAPTWHWRDAKAAMDYWTQITSRLL
jgi:hypothetical protein